MVNLPKPSWTVFFILAFVVMVTFGIAVAALVKSLEGTATPHVEAGTIIVRSPQDLSGKLSSDIRYLITGHINLGSININVPEGGILVEGLSPNFCSLTSDASNYSMFTGLGVGGVSISNLTLTVTGEFSQVFHLKGNFYAAIMLESVSFLSCVSLGVLDSFGGAVESETARIGGTPVLTLDGPWVSYRQDVAGVFMLDPTMSGSLFSAGPNLVFSSRFVTNTNCDLPLLASFSNFSSANFPGSNEMQIIGATFRRGGLPIVGMDTNVMPNLLSHELNAMYKDNLGLDSTHIGGNLLCTANGTSTTVLQNVPVPLEGTFVAQDLQHFDSPAPSQLRYIGDFPLEFSYNTDMVVTTGNANTFLTMNVMVLRGGVTPELLGAQRQIANSAGGTEYAYFSQYSNFILNKNDVVMLTIENNTQNISALTLLAGATLFISAR